MKILYGIQGTGHGHISRARVVLPKLREFADVDVLISGYNFKISIEGTVDFKARGLSLAYDNKGSIDFLGTALGLNPVRFVQDMQRIPVKNYDFIVNDFEPVTAWAAKRAGVPCVAISHQVSFLSDLVPRPDKRSPLAEHLMRYFAPSTAAVGSHYLRYDNFIEPPIIRRHIRDLCPKPEDHVTVYLPAYDHETLTSIFGQIKKVRWHIFSPTCDTSYQKGNVNISPVGKESFLKSIENCMGIVSATGFETSSEAMYLGKKFLTVPIKRQYEQLCNAAALKQLGAEVVYQIDQDFIRKLSVWIDKGKELSLPEISDEDDLVQKIIRAGTEKGHCDEIQKAELV